MHLGSPKFYDAISTAVALGVGFTSWMKVSTKKYAAGYVGYSGSVVFKQMLADATGNTLGNMVAKALFPWWNGSADNNHPLFWGWANSTTFGGVALAVVNYLAKDFVPSYKRLDGLSNIVDGLAYGLIGGGIIGGVFDPPPGGSSQGVGTPSTLVAGIYQPGAMASSSGIVTGNVPYTRGDVSQSGMGGTAISVVA
jgi:hypothetical protein